MCCLVELDLTCLYTEKIETFWWERCVRRFKDGGHDVHCAHGKKRPTCRPGLGIFLTLGALGVAQRSIYYLLSPSRTLTDYYLKTIQMHIALILSTVIGISRAKGLAADQACSARALIYSATADFRHDSIPTAVQALITNGPASNVQFDHTEDQTWFTDDRLAQYDAIVFLQNTGEGKRAISTFRRAAF